MGLMLFINGRINKSGIKRNTFFFPRERVLDTGRFFAEKMKELVKKMKSGRATNLYSLIHKEMEKP